MNEPDQAKEELEVFQRLRQQKKDQTDAKTLHVKATEAASKYEDRLRKNGSSADRAQLLGRLAKSAAKGRDWPQAFALLEEALDACGRCTALADLRKHKGLFHCRTGELQLGEQELEAALELEPDDPEALKTLRMVRNALLEP